jgi:hypothetical protein
MQLFRSPNRRKQNQAYSGTKNIRIVRSWALAVIIPATVVAQEPPTSPEHSLLSNLDIEIGVRYMGLISGSIQAQESGRAFDGIDFACGGIFLGRTRQSVRHLQCN